MKVFKTTLSAERNTEKEAWTDQRVQMQTWNHTSGLRLKAFAGFPTDRRSKMISFMAKSSLSCVETQKNVYFTNPSEMFLHGSSNNRAVQCVHLSNKLNDFDKYVEGHVSWDHTARSFWEKCCYDGVQATGKTRKMYVRTWTSISYLFLYCIS